MTAVVVVTPRLDVNLAPQTLRNELDFLRTVSETTHLSDPDVISDAVRRYERCWLPLVAEADCSESLSPPVDVHWIWHCHMLSPYHYERDCLRLINKVIGHSVRPAAQLEEQRRATADVWKQKYDQEPFDMTDVRPSAQSYYERQSTYDLAAAAGRQSKFFYNVSLPHFRDDRFLQQALVRYRKFLVLKQQHRDAVLVPSYDIDLVWHTHQLHPLLYKQDTSTLLGRMFNHDDTLDDRSPGSPQQEACVKTRQLWMSKYGEHFALPGAMYRGEQPHGRLTDVVALAQPGLAHDMKVQFRLSAGSFESCVIPEHLWEPIPLPRLPEGTNNTCISASHKLVFTCSCIFAGNSGIDYVD